MQPSMSLKYSPPQVQEELASVDEARVAAEEARDGLAAREVTIINHSKQTMIHHSQP